VHVDVGGPDAGYDSDKSEEAVQPDSIRANGKSPGNLQRKKKPRSLSSIKLRPLNADDLEENRQIAGPDETEMDDMGVLDDYSDSDVRPKRGSCLCDYHSRGALPCCSIDNIGYGKYSIRKL
jgi:hypothetical protein